MKTCIRHHDLGIGLTEVVHEWPDTNEMVRAEAERMRDSLNAQDHGTDDVYYLDEVSDD